MEKKSKNTIRKIIYILLFTLIILCFVYISNKYSNNINDDTKIISDYYNEISDDTFEVIDGKKMINKIKNGNNLIFIGSSQSKWSAKYIEQLEHVAKELELDKIYYYDLNNDKSQMNTNYYDVRELLKGYLTTTDGGENYLLAPSFYIINNGKVLYYNNDTVAVKNTLSVNDYWNDEKIFFFEEELKNNINRYYLNN